MNDRLDRPLRIVFRHHSEAAQRSGSAPARRQLLKRLAIVFYPTCDMPTLRVMVRPMEDSAFGIPDILAVEADSVACF